MLKSVHRGPGGNSKILPQARQKWQTGKLAINALHVRKFVWTNPEQEKKRTKPANWTAFAIRLVEKRKKGLNLMSTIKISQFK